MASAFQNETVSLVPFNPVGGERNRRVLIVSANARLAVRREPIVCYPPVPPPIKKAIGFIEANHALPDVENPDPRQMDTIASEVADAAALDANGVLVFAVIRLVQHDPVNSAPLPRTIQRNSVDSETVSSGDVEQTASSRISKEQYGTRILVVAPGWIPAQADERRYLEGRAGEDALRDENRSSSLRCFSKRFLHGRSIVSLTVTNGFEVAHVERAGHYACGAHNACGAHSKEISSGQRGSGIVGHTPDQPSSARIGNLTEIRNTSH